MKSVLSWKWDLFKVELIKIGKVIRYHKRKP